MGNCEMEQKIFIEVLRILGEVKAKYDQICQKDDSYVEILLDGEDSTSSKFVTDQDATNKINEKEYEVDDERKAVESVIENYKNVENKRECGICFKIFTKKSYYVHQNLHKQKYKCTDCDKHYSTNSVLQEHIQSIHQKNFSFKCEHCVYRSNSKLRMETHRRIHTGEKPFKCQMCEYRCGDRTSLFQHSRRDHTIQVNCNVCGMTFLRKSELTKHERNHTNVEQKQTEKKCSLCDEVFPDLKTLSTHKNEKHVKKKDEGFKTKYCDVCKKEFSSRQSFKHHTIAAHTKEFPEICDGCGRGFTGTGLGETLEKHKRNCFE